MSDLIATRWRISDQAIANAVADETVILHLGSGTYFGLDAIGARLWDAIVAGTPVSDVVEAVLATYDVDRATVERDMRELLASLAENDLILADA
ncbi:MAG: PqqD family protein [Erythrobacter sp.]